MRPVLCVSVHVCWWHNLHSAQVKWFLQLYQTSVTPLRLSSGQQSTNWRQQTALCQQRNSSNLPGCVCVGLYVCVCVCMAEREREREREVLSRQRLLWAFVRSCCTLNLKQDLHHSCIVVLSKGLQLPTAHIAELWLRASSQQCVFVFTRRKSWTP